jgi:hypothetical protein
MPGQVSPPSGVPRAAASGVFDMSDEPDPEPSKMPRYRGDEIDDENGSGRFGLESRINAELGLDPPTVDEPQTLELENQSDALLVVESSDRPATESDEARPITAAGTLGDDFAPVGVRVTRPAEESLQGRTADVIDDDATQEEPRTPYGLVAGIILAFAAAGFAVGLSGPRDAPAIAPLPTEAGAAAKITALPEEGPEGDDVAPSLPRDATAPQLAGAVVEAEELYKRGRTVDARARVEEVLAADPKQARALVLRANLLVEADDLDGALASAQAAVDADASLADGHLAVGVIQQERDQLEAAAAAYGEYLELAPEGLYAQVVRRQLQRLKRRIAEASAEGGAPKP